MKKEVKEIRDGIMMLHTSRFGSLMELVIKEIYNLEYSKGVTCNLWNNKTGSRVAVAFSRAVTNSKNNVRINPIGACLESNIRKRLVNSTSNGKKYSCYFQQLKPNYFDYLYYGILYKDSVAIFKIKNNQLCDVPHFSRSQHRDNKNECQFSVDNSTISWHMKNNFVRFISYEEIFEILKRVSDPQ